MVLVELLEELLEELLDGRFLFRDLFPRRAQSIKYIYI
jgi:hypothetical protein